MPLYEYQCQKCGFRFERLQKFSDPPPEACPECGGAVAQLLSPPAVQFKGSGWYVTDYARKSSPPSGDGGKGETTGKPAEKSPPKSDSGSASDKK